MFCNRMQGNAHFAPHWPAHISCLKLADAAAPPVRTVEQMVADYQNKAEQAIILNLVTAFQIGRTGRPLSSLVQQGDLMRVTKHQLWTRMHWTRAAADSLTDAIDAVLRSTTRELVQSARFLSLSHLTRSPPSTGRAACRCTCTGAASGSAVMHL